MFAMYVKNVGYFLVFSVFVRVITPNSRYKGFVDVVLGLLLIIVILGPIQALLSQAASIKLAGVEEASASARRDEKYYQGFRSSVLKNAFDKELKEQLTALLAEEGFVLTQLDTEVNEDFTAVTKMELTVYAEDKGVPFIRVEAKEASLVEISNIKNRISNVYNLSGDNIHIVRLDKH